MLRRTVLVLWLPIALLAPACADEREMRGDGTGLGGLDEGALDTMGEDTGGAETGSPDPSGTDGPMDTSASGPDPTGTSGDDGAGDETGGGGVPLEPPAGGSSGGSGGGRVDGELLETQSGVFYRMIAPAGAGPMPFLLVYSGTEGSQPMSVNLLNFRGATGTESFAIAVLHGVEYYGDTQAGIDVIDEVRRLWDIDNDRTYLMSESAGTIAGLELGLQVRQSYFAAYWANDVNASALPASTADELGFQPYGNSGPGGQFQLANDIVGGMEAAGYRTPEPSPYDGPGASVHGDLDQLVAAIAWFPGKTRQ